VIDSERRRDVAAFAGAAVPQGPGADREDAAGVDDPATSTAWTPVRIAREMADCLRRWPTAPDHPTPFPSIFNGTFEKWDD